MRSVGRAGSPTKTLRRKITQPELAQPRVVIRTAAQRPVELALAFLDRHIVNAGEATVHQAIRFEFPVLITVGAKPVTGIIMPLVSVTHGDAVIGKRPELFDQAVIQLFSTCGSGNLSLLRGWWRTQRGYAIGYPAYRRARLFRVAAVPAIFSKSNFLDGCFTGKRWKWRASLGVGHGNDSSRVGQQSVITTSGIQTSGRKLFQQKLRNFLGIISSVIIPMTRAMVIAPSIRTNNCRAKTGGCHIQLLSQFKRVVQEFLLVQLGDLANGIFRVPDLACRVDECTTAKTIRLEPAFQHSEHVQYASVWRGCFIAFSPEPLHPAYVAGPKAAAAISSLVAKWL